MTFSPVKFTSIKKVIVTVKAGKLGLKEIDFLPDSFTSVIYIYYKCKGLESGGKENDSFAG